MAKRKWSEEEIDEYRRQHNMYFIYYNKDDDNLVVPRADDFKMLSLTGLTINFAHPIAKMFVLLLLAIILFPLYFNAKYGM